jgi:hypothetical protein
MGKSWACMSRETPASTALYPSTPDSLLTPLSPYQRLSIVSCLHRHSNPSVPFSKPVQNCSQAVLPIESEPFPRADDTASPFVLMPQTGEENSDISSIVLKRIPRRQGLLADDDWSGLSSAAERRKLQNRLNQRARRESFSNRNPLNYSFSDECHAYIIHRKKKGGDCS